LCARHYSSWRYDTKVKSKAPPKQKKFCSVFGCESPYQARGFCNVHYQKWLRAEASRKREVAGLVKRRAICTVDGCGSFVTGQGFCNKHYQRAKINDMLADLPRCMSEGCTGPSVAKGLCNTHYAGLRRRRRGIHERDPEPLDGRYFYPNGYVMIRRPDHPNAGANGMIFEHRFVMSEMIGRPLIDDENVHHKNGDRADNRPENLELWSTSQPRGQRVEDKLRWCREFLAQYEGFIPT
jgi:hypothetical protein